jgi:microcystin-dependent protein
MPTPYLGEIRITPYNFAPAGWAFCDGQLLPISQYAALFSLLGTSYGGDGIRTFALPNLQSRIPRHPSDHTNGPGMMGGAERVSLAASQLPVHSHTLNASAATGMSSVPGGALPAEPNAGALYADIPAEATLVVLDAGSIAPTGYSVAHNNLQPYLAVAFIIALQGSYPPRT